MTDYTRIILGGDYGEFLTSDGKNFKCSNGEQLKVGSVGEFATFSDSLLSTIERVYGVAPSDTITHTDAVIANYNSVLIDTLSATEALLAGTLYEISRNDSVSLQDTITLLYHTVLGLSDSVAHSDSLTESIHYRKTLSDVYEIAEDILSTTFTYLKEPTDDVTFQDSLSHIEDRARLLSEGVTMSDSSANVVDRIISDSLSVTDIEADGLNKVLVCCTLSFQDYIALTLGTITELSETLSHTDTLVRDVQIILADSLETLDSLQRMFGWTKTHSDTLTTADSTLRIYTWLGTLSDAVTLADTIVKNVDTVNALSETLTHADSIGIRDVSIILSDTFQAQEQLAKLLERLNVDDAITFADSISTAYILTLSESISHTDDAVSDNRAHQQELTSFSDSIGMILDWCNFVSETVTVTDDKVVTLVRDITDTFSVTDVAQSVKDWLLTIADVVTHTESLVRSIDYINEVAQTVFHDDSSSRDILRNLTDIIHAQESLIWIQDAMLSDVITFADSISRGKGTVLTVSDTVVTSDTFARSVLRTVDGEIVQLDDSVAQEISLALLESFDVDEYLSASAVRSLLKTEGITLSDTVTKTVYHVYNSVVFSKAGNPYSHMITGRGRITPVRSPLLPRQIINTGDSGVVQCVTLADTDNYYEVILHGMSPTQKDNLLGFLRHSSVNFSQNTFTFTPEQAINEDSKTVRLWNVSGFEYPLKKGGLYNVKMLLREEVST